jgi:hypothetical protein
MIERHVSRCPRIVKTPIGVFLYDDRTEGLWSFFRQASTRKMLPQPLPPLGYMNMTSSFLSSFFVQVQHGKQCFCANKTLNPLQINPYLPILRICGKLRVNAAVVATSAYDDEA